MASTSRHVSELIARPAAEVYAFVSEPANLPQWAAGLGGNIDLVDGRWTAESPMGTVTVEFAPHNDFGVLDHWVTLPTGDRAYNPLRVLEAGDGSEIVFSVRRAPGVSDADFEADAAAVRADLATLKTVLER